MRTSTVVTTLVAVTAGLTAATALHRRSGRHLTAPDAAVTAPAAGPVVEVQDDGVVLPFVRPVPAPAAAVAPPVPEPSAAPARCGDSGGRTKAGAPCAARATTAGRCHHHRQAA
jgi:hypothetical protein